MGKQWNIDWISAVFRLRSHIFAVLEGFLVRFTCDCTLAMLPKFSFMFFIVKITQLKDSIGKMVDIFSSYNSLWSATEEWISVTENIATSNPLQERRHGMKTESPAHLLWETISNLVYKTIVKTSSHILCCCTYHQPFLWTVLLLTGFWDC